MEQSEKIGAYSIAVNGLLVLIKGALACLSGSVALTADAIHSSTDVISSATVLAGIKISKRKSRRFPYGLYKVENFVSLLSSIFIFLAGYEIIRTVFVEKQSLRPEYLPYAVAGVLVSLGITFSFSRYELKRGRELNSPSLIADARHIRTDMLSSLVILAGLVGGFFGWELDKLAALVVAVLIFKAGIAILVDALRVLLDASVDFETLDRVKTIITGDSQVASVNALWGRSSGPFKFIEADIVIKARDLEKAHAASRRIENEIRKQVSHVDHILIHYEPRKKKTSTCAVPLAEDKMTLSEHFGDAPCFYVASRREDDGTLISETYFRNPYAKEDKGKGIRISEWLLSKGVDTVYSPKDVKGRGPGYVFSDADVDVIVAPGKTLDDIRGDFTQGADPAA